MTIKDLRKAIQDLPDEMEVYIGKRLSEYQYGLVNGIEVKNIIIEDVDNEEDGLIEAVLILEEE